jgi:hemerythrin
MAAGLQRSPSAQEAKGKQMPIWKPSYSIGVPAIDAQHKELFARADRLLLAMREGRAAAECQRLFAFLRAYCQTHFGAEERLMKELRYPGMLPHLAQHAEFNRRFEELLGEFSQMGANSMLVIELQNLIGGWLVKHIGVMDAELANSLGTGRQSLVL